MSVSNTATSTACGWWALAPGGFRTEAFCELPNGHAGDHHDAHGVVVLPADAERIGDMCARFDEDDSGTLCVREPGHPGLCRNRSGYVFKGVESDDSDVPDHPHNTAAQEAGRVRVYASGGSPALPCPVSGCALLAGHSGRCMDLDALEWKGYV